MGEDKVTTLIIDDQRLARMFIKHDLLDDSRVQIIGEAATGAQGLHLVEKRKPDVVVLDYYLADMNGLEVLGRIRLIRPETIVILLTACEDIQLLSELQASSANAVMTKDSYFSVVDVVHFVKAGRRYFQPNLVHELVDHCKNQCRVGT